jgi:microcystin-dependent protein
MAIRDGFIIPNAATYAPDFQTAQPDQGDFVILGNANYGVYNGCEISLDGSTVSLSGDRPHILAVNGVVYEIYALPSSWTGGIDTADSDPRFDLVVFDSSANALRVVRGISSTNPVFPDIDSNMTVLAAVYTPGSVGGGGNRHIIDKRNLLQKVVTGVNSPTVVRSYGYADGATSVKFNIDGNGKFNWQGFQDASIERTGAGVLSVTSELEATTLTATESATVAGADVVTTDTISWGTTLPASADIGDVFINNNTVGTSGGSLYVWKVNDGTQEWVPIEPQTPVGSVIMSILPQSQMPGWLLLDGSSVDEATADGLWGKFPINPETNLMTLPDMRGRFPLGAGQLGALGSGDVNVSRGTITDDDGTITVTMTPDQMPSHRHQSVDDTTTGSSGSHSHNGTATSAGAHTHVSVAAPNHTHSATDSGHWHYWEGGFPMVAIIPGTEGDSCMDIIFSDRSHTYVTRPEPHSMFGTANITVAGGGGHNHGIEPGGTHNHTVAIDVSSTHTHTAPTHVSAGNGLPMTFRPPSLSLNFYIKK